MGLRLQHLVLKSDLPHRLRLLCLVLAFHAKEDGSDIFPRVATLARELGLHRTNVIRQLRELRERGILQVVEASGGRRRATRYRLVLSALTGSEGATESAEQVAQALPVADEQVAQAHPTRSAGATHKSLVTASASRKSPTNEELSGKTPTRPERAPAYGLPAVKEEEEWPL